MNAKTLQLGAQDPERKNSKPGANLAIPTILETARMGERMENELDPIVGNWYRRIDRRELFRVVGLDEQRDNVEIQNFDGDVEKIDVNAWFDMDLELAEEPEDWTGPIDDPDVDDLDDGETSAAQGGAGVALKTGGSGEWEVEQLEDERALPDDGDSDVNLDELER